MSMRGELPFAANSCWTSQVHSQDREQVHERHEKVHNDADAPWAALLHHGTCGLCHSTARTAAPEGVRNVRPPATLLLSAIASSYTYHY